MLQSDAGSGASFGSWFALVEEAFGLHHRQPPGRRLQDERQHRVEVGRDRRDQIVRRGGVQPLPPGAAPLGVSSKAAMATSQPGQQPSRAVAEVTRVVSDITAGDPVNHTVTLRAPDGALRTL